MSNNISASFDAAPSAAPAVETNQMSIWRRMFNAWLQSYANRLDPEGNVFCEL
jgi:hypothetical protein